MVPSTPPSKPAASWCTAAGALSPRGNFDHNATTPLDPRVLDAMLPWLGERHGNPSSSHRRGRQARRAVREARGKVARLLSVEAAQIVFTSSGSEANNWVVAERLSGKGRRRFVHSSFEHPSVVQAGERAARAGVEVVPIAPRGDGVVDAEEFLAALDDRTQLAALMLANNEIGTLQPVAEVAAGCRRAGVPLLCDAVQAVGKVPVSIPALGADYVTIAAHKFHGPLGVAALWVAADAPLSPLLVGGGQEGGRRASTENVAGIVGLGRTAELAVAELDARCTLLRKLRDRLEDGLARLPGIVVNGVAAARLPNTCSLTIAGVRGDALASRLDEWGFAVSTGAACHSGQATPSPTIVALGHSPAAALGTVRVSFGFGNTPAEVDEFLALLPRALEELPRR